MTLNGLLQIGLYLVVLVLGQAARLVHGSRIRG